MKMTFGADFEAFVQVDGKIIPICGLLGGTKEEPIQFPDAPEGFKYQEDGVTAEFNIPPCETTAQFGEALNTAVSLGQKLIKEKFGKKATLVWKSGHHFPIEELVKHEQAMKVGCDPDCQAYFEGKDREVPDIEKMGGWRFAGFHIHVGYEQFRLPEWMMALVMDEWLFRRVDDSCYTREEFYPRGIFRKKPYGVEWRALGSAMVPHRTLTVDSLRQMQEALTMRFSETVDASLAHKDQTADLLLGGNGRTATLRTGRTRGLQFVVPPARVQVNLREPGNW